MSDFYGGINPADIGTSAGGGGGFNASAILQSLLGPAMGGGPGPLASLLGGAATAQRIPGQTTAGEFLPGQNSLGATYNYIPTGATQIDPALISQILGQGQTAGNISSLLLQGGLPALQGLLSPGMMQQFGNALPGAVGALQNQANFAGGMGTQLANTATGQRDAWNQLIGQAFQPGFDINQASQIGQQYGTTGQGVGSLGQQLINLYGNIGQQALYNPFNAQALGGAQQAGQMLGAAGQGAYGQGAQLSGAAGAGLPASMQVLNTAFDPQSQLYNRTLQQLQDQLGTYMARSGLTGSGAGGKIASDALSNFNIDWQNQQLGRQTQGLNAFNQGVGGVGQNFGQANQLQTGGAGQVATGAGLPAQVYGGQTAQQLGVLGQLGGGYQTGAQLQGTGLGMQAAGNQYVPQQYQNLVLAPEQAALQGAGNFLGQQGNAYAGANNLFGAQGQALYNTGALPYNAMQTMGQNQLGALGQYGGLGTQVGNLNNQSIQQMLSYLDAVMKGSRNAADATKNTADITQKQNAAAGASAGGLIQSGLGLLGSLVGL